jgi:hypothetical protein
MMSHDPYPPFAEIHAELIPDIGFQEMNKPQVDEKRMATKEKMFFKSPRPYRCPTPRDGLVLVDTCCEFSHFLSF